MMRHRRYRRQFRLRVGHLLFAVLGAVATLIVVANIEPVADFAYDYLVIDRWVEIEGNATSPLADVSPEDRPAELKVRLDEIDDAIELKEIEQGQLVLKIWDGALTESPRSLQRMQDRAEALELEIMELRSERDVILGEIRKQPVPIVTLTPKR